MPDAPDILSRRRVFEGRKIAVEVHRVRDADGREAEREVVVHGGSVAILAFPEPDVVLLERNWRYAMGREMIELPAGTRDEGEESAACAVRELQEETGYRAAEVEPLAVIHPSPGFLTERLEIVLARDVRPGEPAREAGEAIENRLVPFEEALAMVDAGRITDAKTIVGLLLWARRKGRA